MVEGRISRDCNHSRIRPRLHRVSTLVTTTATHSERTNNSVPVTTSLQADHTAVKVVFIPRPLPTARPAALNRDKKLYGDGALYIAANRRIPSLEARRVLDTVYSVMVDGRIRRDCNDSRIRPRGIRDKAAYLPQCDSIRTPIDTNCSMFQPLTETMPPQTQALHATPFSSPALWALSGSEQADVSGGSSGIVSQMEGDGRGGVRGWLASVTMLVASWVLRMSRREGSEAWDAALQKPKTFSKRMLERFSVNKHGVLKHSFVPD
ncbi:unnamed protein product [Pleuronectes platessa]|uniref:Uncharacterized protein n=1 Tax=Pleuronectes platessa TaxID=8262 RepID=A0A9N7VW38_PLEPL|nr:unnamed protein product [Pleuronectes platessa]